LGTLGQRPAGLTVYTDKKENKIFLIYKEIQSGAIAKLYMRKCANISPYLRRLLVIFVFATAPF
jgi:hypothetical protein